MKALISALLYGLPALAVIMVVQPASGAERAIEKSVVVDATMDQV